MSSFGLVSFLFLVGVETDTDLIIKYWKSVVLITVPPFAASFAVCVGIAKLIYDHLGSQDVPFTTFFVFVGTVMAVTSLSVLSRVLAEMGLLTSRLGATSIAAGAANDTLGYCLLAIGSSLAGGGKQIFALYQLLAFTAYLLLLIVVWRPFLFWLIKREGIDLSPDSKDYVPRWLILIAVLGGLFSCCMSDMFGLHQLVGAFAYGVVIPHGRYGIAVTEAIETPIVSIFLPLYFGAVGLQIDFKTMNNGVTWGLTVLLIAASLITKGSTTAICSRLAGLTWRQSMCVGALMQSKGVIEVVIGGIALQDGVIDTRIFSMLFFTFIFTTCTVRPLARAIYLKQAEQEKQHHRAPSVATDSGDWNQQKASDTFPTTDGQSQQHSIFGITVAMPSINPSVGGLMTLMGMIGDHSLRPGTSSPKITLDILRLLPVEYSPASILRLLFWADQEHQQDPLLASLKTVAGFKSVKSSRSLPFARVEAVSEWGDSTEDGDTLNVTESQMIPTILKAHKKVLSRCAEIAHQGRAAAVQGLVICPWEAPAHIAHSQNVLSSLLSSSNANPEDDSRLWRASADAQALPARLFRQHQTDTGVLVNADALRDVFTTGQQHSKTTHASLQRSVGLDCRGSHRRPRVIVPFFGGPDDRAAVALARAMAETTSGLVDVVVVASSEVDALRDTASGGDRDGNATTGHVSALDPSVAARLIVEEQEPRSAEEQNQETVNLQTIHQPEARHADARFLFGSGVGGSVELDPVAESSNEEEDSRGKSVGLDGNANIKVRLVDGMRLVSIAPDSRGTVDSLVSTSAALLDRRYPSDLIIVGRGKQGSRPAGFRTEVDALRHTAQHPEESNSLLRRIRREEADEIRAMGRTLGAAAEGVLLYGLSEDGECGACMLVVQSATESGGTSR